MLLDVYSVPNIEIVILLMFTKPIRLNSLRPISDIYVIFIYITKCDSRPKNGCGTLVLTILPLTSSTHQPKTQKVVRPTQILDLLQIFIVSIGLNCKKIKTEIWIIFSTFITCSVLPQYKCYHNINYLKSAAQDLKMDVEHWSSQSKTYKRL